MKQGAGDGAAPQGAGLVRAASFQGPEEFDIPGDRDAAHGTLGFRFVVGLGWKSGSCDFIPRFPVIGGTVKLGPEMAMLQGGVERLIARVAQDHGHLGTKKNGARDIPFSPTIFVEE